MRYRLFNTFQTEMICLPGGIKFTFNKYSDTILENIAKLLNLNPINVKYYLSTGDKKLTEKLKNSRMQQMWFKGIIENYKGDMIQTATYETGSVTLQSKNRTYKIAVDGRKLLFFVTI